MSFWLKIRPARTVGRDGDPDPGGSGRNLAEEAEEKNEDVHQSPGYELTWP